MRVKRGGRRQDGGDDIRIRASFTHSVQKRRVRRVYDGGACTGVDRGGGCGCAGCVEKRGSAVVVPLSERKARGEGRESTGVMWAFERTVAYDDVDIL
jgi:hypothetical protein